MLDTDKTARAAVAIAAAYALCHVSKHSEPPQLAAANAIALIVIIAILYGPHQKIYLTRHDARCYHPPLQGVV